MTAVTAAAPGGGAPGGGVPGGGVLDRLRTATQAAHRDLEARLDVVEALGCPVRRPVLVARYRAFHGAAAALLRPWPMEGTASWLDGYGDEVVRGDGWWREFAPREAAEAAGLRYVVEGSALGGRVILKALRARGVDTAELGFLDPWGERAGTGWRALVGAIERVARDERSLRAAVDGAERGFAFAGRALCDPGPDARAADGRVGNGRTGDGAWPVSGTAVSGTAA